MELDNTPDVCAHCGRENPDTCPRVHCKRYHAAPIMSPQLQKTFDAIFGKESEQVVVHEHIVMESTPNVSLAYTLTESEIETLRIVLAEAHETALRTIRNLEWHKGVADAAADRAANIQSIQRKLNL